MIQALLKQHLRLHGSQAEAARALGISPQYLGMILAGKRTCGPKVLRKLGLKRVTRYEVAS